MTKIIGLTGGIGSGKTTVAKEFEAFGVPIYIADLEARKIMELPETIEAVGNEFGSMVLDEGKLNREQLAHIVFNDAEKLKRLNAIVHPLVGNHFKEWVAEHKDAVFVIKEAAILFESGSDKDCDKVIAVVAPLETRIQRVLERDGTGRDAVLKRIENQWTDEMRIAKSDYVIENISLENTKNQVAKLYQVMKEM